MKHIVIREYERLFVDRSGPKSISRKHFRRLRKFDSKQAGREGSLIFEWRHNKLWAKNWVGVVQIGGLTVEILPKVEKPSKSDNDETLEHFARRNLLYMLALAGEVPMRTRDVADIATQGGTLLDIYVDIFARRLTEQLKKGLDKDYVRREENLSVLRGKLKFGDHISKNAGRHDRFYVAYDEYLPDTPLNRIFKAACHKLRRAVQRPTTDEKLKNAAMLFADVSDVVVTPMSLDRISFDRRNRRFKECFDFCRMLLLGQAPTASHGQTRTFSVLFDMNSVYEKFITEFIRRYVLVDELDERLHLDPQSKKVKKYLLWAGEDKADEKGPVRLKPDILIQRRGTRDGETNFIVIDTKWKELGEKDSGGVKGVSTSDLYQLYAYARRYNAQNSLLLYPNTVGELASEDYVLPETDVPALDGPRKRVGLEFIDLDRDLRAERLELAEELTELLESKLPEQGAGLTADIESEATLQDESDHTITVG